MERYTSREQVAGYFDGDGYMGISDVSNRPYKLGLSIVFTDQSFDQIANIRDFLLGHEIKTSNILKTSKGTAYIVVVGGYESVKKTLRSMLPHLYKKANEIQAVLDYYKNKISGNKLLEVFREEVGAGRRERRQHRVALDIPYTRQEGLALMKARRKERLRDAFGRFRPRVTPEDFDRIRREHFDEGKRLRDLVKEYPQYARETIRRVLGSGRGSVGLKGSGRVDTTATTIRDPRTAPN